jgi:hypothetical protein
MSRVSRRQSITYCTVREMSCQTLMIELIGGCVGLSAAASAHPLPRGGTDSTGSATGVNAKTPRRQDAKEILVAGMNQLLKGQNLKVLAAGMNQLLKGQNLKALDLLFLRVSASWRLGG